MHISEDIFPRVQVKKRRRSGATARLFDLCYRRNRPEICTRISGTDYLVPPFNIANAGSPVQCPVYIFLIPVLRMRTSSSEDL